MRFSVCSPRGVGVSGCLVEFACVAVDSGSFVFTEICQALDITFGNGDGELVMFFSLKAQFAQFAVHGSCAVAVEGGGWAGYLDECRG